MSRPVPGSWRLACAEQELLRSWSLCWLLSLSPIPLTPPPRILHGQHVWIVFWNEAMFEDDSGLLALFSCEDTVFRVLLDARGGSCWRLFLPTRYLFDSLEALHDKMLQQGKPPPPSGLRVKGGSQHATGQLQACECNCSSSMHCLMCN
jgi:hypothetical protein